MRVIGKLEPTKVSKLEDDRERIVFVVALVDQIVTRWFMLEAHEEQIAMCDTQSCKIGWAPLPTGWREYLTAFGGKEVLNTDCSAMDWTVNEWMVDAVTELWLELCRHDDPAYEKGFRRLIREILGPGAKVYLPDGTCAEQEGWGVMKSGCLFTALGNSYILMLTMIIAWLRTFPSQPFPLSWQLGDDWNMVWPKSREEAASFVANVQALGLVIKRYDFNHSFAGFNITGTLSKPVVEPAYSDKHRFILNHVDDLDMEDVCTAYSLLYTLAPPSDLKAFVDSRSLYTKSVREMWAHGMLADIGTTLSLRETWWIR